MRYQALLLNFTRRFPNLGSPAKPVSDALAAAHPRKNLEDFWKSKFGRSGTVLTAPESH